MPFHQSFLKLKVLRTENVHVGLFIREICKVLAILVVTAHYYGVFHLGETSIRQRKLGTST
jgi:hypothetical protein